MTISSKIFAVALTGAAAALFGGPVAAAPISSPLAMQNAVTPSLDTVQYRRGYRGGYRGRGFGGAGLGIAAGALIGGAIIGATQPYGYRGYGPGYAYAPAYAYEPGYGPGYVAVAPGGDGVAYCAQRYRSYDPGSGTFLGFDGLRHPCP
jgi:hypothetical protein